MLFLLDGFDGVYRWLKFHGLFFLLLLSVFTCLRRVSFTYILYRMGIVYLHFYSIL